MKGRPEDIERNKAIAEMLRRGAELEQRNKATGCSRSTLSKLAMRASAASLRSS